MTLSCFTWVGDIIYFLWTGKLSCVHQLVPMLWESRFKIFLPNSYSYLLPCIVMHILKFISILLQKSSILLSWPHHVKITSYFIFTAYRAYELTSVSSLATLGTEWRVKFCGCLLKGWLQDSWLRKEENCVLRIPFS